MTGPGASYTWRWLYGSETRVITPHIGRVLSGFLHRVSHSIMGRQPRQGSNGMWKYPRRRTRWQRRDFRRWRPTSPAAITQSYSSLKQVPLCTFFYWRCGYRGQGLFNSTSTICRLGYCGLRIRIPLFIQIAKEPLLHN